MCVADEIPSTGYNTTFQEDKTFGKSAYAVSGEVEMIQKEIMTNGPVEGAFTVYADFPSYKSGETDVFKGGCRFFFAGVGVVLIVKTVASKSYK